MSAESSKRVSSMAAAMLDHDDPAVRSLAGSVLRQFEPDEGGRPPIKGYGKQPREFWEGFWAGMWACQGR